MFLLIARVYFGNHCLLLFNLTDRIVLGAPGDGA